MAAPFSEWAKAGELVISAAATGSRQHRDRETMRFKSNNAAGVMSALLVCCEPCLQGVVCHLRRKHDASFGAERHGELANEQVGLFGGKIDCGGLSPVLNDGAARGAFRLGRCLAVVLQDIKDDLLTLADELDRVALDHDDVASIGSFLGTLCRRAMRDDGKQQCN